MKMATFIKIMSLQRNANRPPAGARYKRTAILVVRLGEPMSRNTNRPPTGARYKQAVMFVVRLGQDRGALLWPAYILLSNSFL